MPSSPHPGGSSTTSRALELWNTAIQLNSPSLVGIETQANAPSVPAFEGTKNLYYFEPNLLAVVHPLDAGSDDPSIQGLHLIFRSDFFAKPASVTPSTLQNVLLYGLELPSIAQPFLEGLKRSGFMNLVLTTEMDRFTVQAGQLGAIFRKANVDTTPNQAPQLSLSWSYLSPEADSETPHPILVHSA